MKKQIARTAGRLIVMKNTMDMQNRMFVVFLVILRDFALKNKNPCSACEFQAKQGISIWGIKLLFFSV